MTEWGVCNKCGCHWRIYPPDMALRRVGQSCGDCSTDAHLGDSTIAPCDGVVVAETDQGLTRMQPLTVLGTESEDASS